VDSLGYIYVNGAIVIGITIYFLSKENTGAAKRYSHRLGCEVKIGGGNAGVRVEGDVGELFLAARARRLGEQVEAKMDNTSLIIR
jgi:hypothetical protein